MIKKIEGKRQQGFTLIEIMVVVAIIGMLASFILPNIMGQTDKASLVKAKADIKAIETAAKLYKLENFKYPASISDLTSKDSNGNSFLDAVPKDPWDKPYTYASPGSNRKVDVSTTSPDGKLVSNWSDE